MSAMRFGIVVIALAGLPLAAAPHRGAADQRSRDHEWPRTDHAVGYYDAQIRRVVLVGGAGDPQVGDHDRMWSWSGTGWDRLSTTGPAGRVNAAAAYDMRGRRAVVAGGARKRADGTTWDVIGDAWAAESEGWHELDAITPRDHHAMVDDGQDGVVLFGGIAADRTSPWPTDTWRLRGSTWQRVATDGPAGRGRTAMAYDARRKQVVLFGGVSAPPAPNQPQTFLADTWTWDGRWRRAAAAGPRGRYAHGMVFDARAGVVLLYGGAAAHRDAPLSDMWMWDGSRWTELELSTPTPGHRYQPVMVYDRARDRTVLHGGIGGPGDTWEWDGRSWRRVGP